MTRSRALLHAFVIAATKRTREEEHDQDDDVDMLADVPEDTATTSTAPDTAQTMNDAMTVLRKHVKGQWSETYRALRAFAEWFDVTPSPNPPSTSTNARTRREGGFQVLPRDMAVVTALQALDKTGFLARPDVQLALVASACVDSVWKNTLLFSDVLDDVLMQQCTDVQDRRVLHQNNGASTGIESAVRSHDALLLLKEYAVCKKSLRLLAALVAGDIIHKDNYPLLLRVCKTTAIKYETQKAVLGAFRPYFVDDVAIRADPYHWQRCIEELVFDAKYFGCVWLIETLSDDHIRALYGRSRGKLFVRACKFRKWNFVARMLAILASKGESPKEGFVALGTCLDGWDIALPPRSLLSTFLQPPHVDRMDDDDCRFGIHRILMSADHGPNSLEMLRWCCETPFVTRYVDLSRRNVYMNVLSSAAHWGDLPIIRYLCNEAPPHVNVDIGFNHYKAVSCAAANGKLDVLRFFATLPRSRIRFNDDGSWVAEDTYSVGAPLCTACSNGQFAAVQFLCEELPAEHRIRGGDYNNAPLYWAARTERMEIVKYLLHLPKTHGVNAEAAKRIALDRDDHVALDVLRSVM